MTTPTRIAIYASIAALSGITLGTGAVLGVSDLALTLAYGALMPSLGAVAGEAWWLVGEHAEHQPNAPQHIEEIAT